MFVVVGVAGAMPCTAHAGQVDDIHESVFRWLFDNYDSTARARPPQVYFISIAHNVDPSPGLLRRFVHHSPPIRAVSEATYHDDIGAVDNHTGERGVILNIAEIRWVSDVEVQVDDDFLVSSSGGGGYTHTLNFKGGKWVVTKVRGRYSV